MARKATARTDRVNFASANVTTNGSRTLMIWAKGSAVPQVVTGVYEDVISVGQNVAGNAMTIVWDHDSTTYYGSVVHEGAGSTWDRVQITSGWQTNKWHCIVGTYNATTQELYAYLDGTQFGPATGVADNNTTAGRVCFLADEANAANGQGSLNKETGWGAFWNVVLTQNEINALARGVDPQHIRPDAIVFVAPCWGLHSPEIALKPGLGTGTVTGTTVVNGPPVTLFTPKAWNVQDLSIPGKRIDYRLIPKYKLRGAA